MRAFFDSNILVYAFSTDQRRDIATHVIALGGVINMQVLNEFTNVLRKKQKLTWPLIEQAIMSVHRLLPDIKALVPRVHSSAMHIARDHNVSFYDALIVAAACDAGCDVLFSEDLQHGQKFGELEIVNPFV